MYFWHNFIDTVFTSGYRLEPLDLVIKIYFFILSEFRKQENITYLNDVNYL